VTSDFTGQMAVITGAGGGIGRAIAVGLAKKGADLSLVGRHRETLEEAAEAARAHVPVGKTVSVACITVDLARDEDMVHLTETLRFGAAADLLIHSAGAYAMGPVESAAVADFDYLFRVNVRAPYFLTQSLLPGLRERHGQIVFINSSAGLHARAGVSQYSATKHALKAMADCLRDEVNGAGVRVISVYPGRTASPLQRAVHALEARPYRPEALIQPEDVAEVVLAALCLPRSAEVTDVQVRGMVKLPPVGSQ